MFGVSGQIGHRRSGAADHLAEGAGLRTGAHGSAQVRPQREGSHCQVVGKTSTEQFGVVLAKRGQHAGWICGTRHVPLGA
jgi:hypothetical protein